MPPIQRDAQVAARSERIRWAPISSATYQILARLIFEQHHAHQRVGTRGGLRSTSLDGRFGVERGIERQHCVVEDGELLLFLMRLLDEVLALIGQQGVLYNHRRRTADGGEELRVFRRVDI